MLPDFEASDKKALEFILDKWNLEYCYPLKTEVPVILVKKEGRELVLKIWGKLIGSFVWGKFIPYNFMEELGYQLKKESYKKLGVKLNPGEGFEHRTVIYDSKALRILNQNHVDSVPRREGFTVSKNHYFLLREYIPGKSVSRDNPLPEQEQKSLAELVETCHSLGVANLDLDNHGHIILGEDNKIKLVDFGSCIFRDSISKKGFERYKKVDYYFLDEFLNQQHNFIL